MNSDNTVSYVTEKVEGTTDPDAIDATTMTFATIKNTNAYNLNGQKIGAGYRGITIRNGKKFLKN